MSLDFVAIDFETANNDRASICQVGAVRYVDGLLVDEFVTLVDPKTDFGWRQIQLHKITESDVLGAPAFPEIYDQLISLLDGSVAVAHNISFDRDCLYKAASKFRLSEPRVTWLDSINVAQFAWDKFKEKYSLDFVCEELEYDFEHHDALEDARASAQILLAASAKTGFDIHDWLRHAEQPKKAQSKPSISVPRNEIRRESIGFPEIHFSGFPRVEKLALQREAEEHELHVVTKVTVNLEYFVAGPTVGKKKRKDAEEQNVEILSLDQYREMLEKGQLPN